MDIPNIPQNLIKGLEQKNTEQLTALSRVLDLVLGKTVIATVTSVTPVTPQEKQQLLKQTVDALAQINKQGINVANLSPATKLEISRLMQQQNLVQSPELKWVNLVVNNRPVLTYSDRPLATGQTIPVQLQTGQKLVLLDFPTQSSATSKIAAVENALLNITAQSTLNKNQLVNNFVKITSAPLVDNLAKNANPVETAKNAILEKIGNATLTDKNTSQNPVAKIDGNNAEIKKSCRQYIAPTSTTQRRANSFIFCT